jgi:riboflavin kinase / FMN adenylyltransferase
MKVIQQVNQLNVPERKVSLAIGVFDGVHLGHQQIIRQTINDARQHEAVALIVTFDKHPSAIVAPDRVPPQIYSRSQKIRAIAALGADTLLEIPFTREFSQQTGDTFIRGLVSALGKIQSICVGADFVFGHRRSGDVPLLHRLGAELQFQIHGLAAIALDAQTVSSTRIREAIRAGDFDAASQMLGRAYSLAGPVVRGAELGRQLGFPTANLDTSSRLLPPNGVYAAHAQLGKTIYRAAINIGIRPTVSGPGPAPRVEVHLLDFSGEIYSQELEITFVAKLRDEQKFPSVAALRDQIQKDVAAAREVF